LFGDGSTSRDYTYIDDIIEGTLRSYSYITEYDGYGIYNLGSDNPVSLSELVEILESTTGKRALKTSLPMQSGDVNRTFADISKASNSIGYKAKYDIHKGISHFHEWFLEGL
jgi:UDP-glucuronate 4-epimerase